MRPDTRLRSLVRCVQVVDVIHPGRANVPKDEIRDKLSTLYKSDKEHIFCFGMSMRAGVKVIACFAYVASHV